MSAGAGGLHTGSINFKLCPAIADGRNGYILSYSMQLFLSYAVQVVVVVFMMFFVRFQAARESLLSRAQRGADGAHPDKTFALG